MTHFFHATAYNQVWLGGPCLQPGKRLQATPAVAQLCLIAYASDHPTGIPESTPVGKGCEIVHPPSN